MYVNVFVNNINVKTPFHFTFYLPIVIFTPPHHSQLRLNVITIMTFVLLIRWGHLEVVQILVNGKDTDPNVVNKDGETALHLAAQ